MNIFGNSEVRGWLRQWSGVFLAFGIALTIQFLLAEGISLISPIVIALGLGLILRNIIGVKPVFLPGIRFTARTILKIGIVLLGLRFDFLELLRLGGRGLVLILACFAIAALGTYWGARLAKLPRRLGILIGLGTAICGNSAIMAAAPLLQCDDDEVSVAVGVVTLFGTLAVLVYPVVGYLLQMDPRAFGLWAGTAVNDTSQVLAAAFSYGPEAGAVAVLVKMTRNILMGPALVLISLSNARRSRSASEVSLWGTFPWFVLGFVGLAALNTLLSIPSWLSVSSQTTVSVILLMVLFSVGSSTDLHRLRQLGPKGFLVGLFASLCLACFSLWFVGYGLHWFLAL